MPAVFKGAGILDFKGGCPPASVGNGWVEAGALEQGAQIQTLDGRLVRLLSKSANPISTTTYNLTVANDHSYFVGASGIWVHNVCCGTGVKAPIPPYILKQMEDGNNFNRDRAHAYDYNEVAVEKADGETALRLDSYSPTAGKSGEIVSRKYSQLSKILPQTAVNYLNEFVKKYSPGTVIANTVKTRLDKLNGLKLRGQMYLEVPPQNAAIPQAVLDAAKKRDIIIRDSNGVKH